MIDLAQLRREPDRVITALSRRGVPQSELRSILEADAEHRRLLQGAEALRAEIKDLSRQVGEARRNGNSALAEEIQARSRALGDEERAASEAADAKFNEVRSALLLVPNIPSDDAPDGPDESANVVLRSWWPGMDEGAPFPTYADHQRVAHFDCASELGILDMEAGAKLAGSMFPLLRGAGSSLMRALGLLSLAENAEEYEEIRPPTFALTETMTSTGHLPKSSEDMYAIERDGLWAIPTAEVPLTSMHRGEILDESRLPIKMTAFTACFRREAGAAGRDTRGLLRVHEFDKAELFAYCTPDQAQDCFDDVLARAERLLQLLQLPYRVLDLCCGDLGSSSARTYDLEAYSPGVDKWLEVSSVSWFRDYQSRRANVRFRTPGGAPQLVHTVNGSALGFSRVWAAVVETYRNPDGTITIPEALRVFMGNKERITKR